MDVGSRCESVCVSDIVALQSVPWCVNEVVGVRQGSYNGDRHASMSESLSSRGPYLCN